MSRPDSGCLLRFCHGYCLVCVDLIGLVAAVVTSSIDLGLKIGDLDLVLGKGESSPHDESLQQSLRIYSVKSFQIWRDFDILMRFEFLKLNLGGLQILHWVMLIFDHQFALGGDIVWLQVLRLIWLFLLEEIKVYRVVDSHGLDSSGDKAVANNPRWVRIGGQLGTVRSLVSRGYRVSVCLMVSVVCIEFCIESKVKLKFGGRRQVSTWYFLTVDQFRRSLKEIFMRMQLWKVALNYGWWQTKISGILMVLLLRFWEIVGGQNFPKRYDGGRLCLDFECMELSFGGCNKRFFYGLISGFLWLVVDNIRLKISRVNCDWVSLKKNQRNEGHKSTHYGTVTDFTASDHSPVVATLMDKVPRGKRNFRFDKRWIGKEGLLEAISNGWNSNSELGEGKFVEKLTNCRRAILQWRRELTPYGRQTIEELKSELLLAQGDDRRPREEITELTLRLKEAYRDEELYWHQKSRSFWMQLGDSNSKYFHAEDKDIQNIAVSYFKELFTTTKPEAFEESLAEVQTLITDQINNFLTAPATECESAQIELHNENHGSVGLVNQDQVRDVSLEAEYSGYRCFVDGSWKESDKFSGTGWFCTSSNGEPPTMGAANLRRSLSPLHAEVEALRWAMKCMIGAYNQEVAFFTDCSDLAKMVYSPTEWPTFSVYLEEFQSDKEFSSFFFIFNFSYG
ncbi:Ribonuclease H domain [Arabidopsis suecica]|uniref:Ribonuclease H domain n=1 Tax=Arabidopsis suecica TaxID=45249 RepID=A0A8T2BNN8_ARASU|nr:Ribonuclease H domain [Arabidopsis suecica]